MSERLLLIVDHDAFQRQLVEMLLVSENYTLQKVDTAADALRFLQEKTPNLIIAEANLPDMPAADLCRRIKSIRRLHKVPVIVLTSPANHKTIKALAPAVGIDLVLEKPLGDKALGEKIEGLIAGSGMQSASDVFRSLVTQRPPSESSGTSGEKAPYPVRNLLTKSVLYENDYRLPSINLLPGRARLSKVEKARDTHATNEEQKVPQKSVSFETVSMSKAVSKVPDKAEPKQSPDLQNLAKPFEVKPWKDPQATNDSKAKKTAAEKPEQRPTKTVPEPRPQTKALSSDPASLLPPIRPNPTQSRTNQSSEIALLKKQVEQLLEENEQLKEAIREFTSGVAIVSSQSYLNAVEELEALRRLTEYQAKQLEVYQAKQQIPEEKTQSKTEEGKTVWNRVVGGI